MRLVAALALVLAVSAAAAAQGQAQAQGPAPNPAVAGTALLVIDIQNFYFEKGLVPLTGPVEAADRARVALVAARLRKVPVIHVRHVPKSVAIVDGEPVDPQYRIRPEVAPLAGETIISKQYANSFRETDLLAELQKLGIKRVVIAGMQTHMCVEAASRAATDLGFEVLVLHDACATRPLEFNGKTVPAEFVHAGALAAINGSYGRVISVDEWIKELSTPAPKTPARPAKPPKKK
jgi:nicotinamidase-related amidase